MFLNKVLPTLLVDFYKLCHRAGYPKKTQVVYSTFTCRKSRIPSIKRTVVAGLQMFLKDWIIDFFDEYFFDRPWEDVKAEYIRFVKYTMGDQNPDTEHLKELYDLGYIPLEFRAVAEGTLLPIRVPCTTVHNTDDRFFWLTNYIETLMSTEIWGPMTCATIGYEYKKIFTRYALETVGNADFVPFQGHDFSFRGMKGIFDAAKSGMGHLFSFCGTDTAPAIMAAEHFYNANIENELVGTSVNATEHSLQCAYQNDDLAYFKAMMDAFPKGILSIVSDGYDFWDVIGRVLPELHDVIMEREGKIVIRPDSGDPVQILTGYNWQDAEDDEITSEEYAALPLLVRKGLIECLWDLFGGTITEKGYKLLDSHIGAIYGDSINLERAEAICARLKTKGFASINWVAGIGSYTYQYITRDTFGMAMKATMVIIDGKEIPIYKDPKTDDGTKKSAKGKVAVVERDGEIICLEEVPWNEEVPGDLLIPVFKNGELLVDQNLSDIRAKLTV